MDLKLSRSSDMTASLALLRWASAAAIVKRSSSNTLFGNPVR